MSNFERLSPLRHVTIHRISTTLCVSSRQRYYINASTSHRLFANNAITECDLSPRWIVVALVDKIRMVQGPTTFFDTNGIGEREERGEKRGRGYNNISRRQQQSSNENKNN